MRYKKFYYKFLFPCLSDGLRGCPWFCSLVLWHVNFISVHWLSAAAVHSKQLTLLLLVRYFLMLVQLFVVVSLLLVVFS